MTKTKQTYKVQQVGGDSTLPYPYFIDKKGLVGRQDFWKGKPYKLLGFSFLPEAGDINIFLEDAIKNPNLVIGRYPVFADKDDNWFTQLDPVGEFSEIKVKSSRKAKSASPRKIKKQK